MSKLNTRTLKSLKPDPTKDIFLWDEDLPGFGARVKPSGRIVFVVQYRNRHGRSRRVSLGMYGRLTAEEARAEAKKLQGDIARGNDPAEGLREERKAVLMKDFATTFVEEYGKRIRKKKPRSIEGDEAMLRNDVIPHVGHRKVADISQNDIFKLKGLMAHKPVHFNRVRALLSTMMNFAEQKGIRTDNTNPTRHVKKYPEHKHERHLTSEEFKGLAAVLAAEEKLGKEMQSVINAIRLLIFTGCRREEILSLKWEYVDRERGVLALPDSKTGAKLVRLNTAASDLLGAIEPEKGNPYIITGRVQGQRLVNIEKPWRRIRGKAGLHNVRLHDLRHSFASVAVNIGEGLPIIGKLLGHNQISTTERYAHLYDDPVRAANERVGEALRRMMEA